MAASYLADADFPARKKQAMLERIAGNGVRAILIESPDRFARDLMVGEVGYRYLAEQGIELIPTTAPTHYTDETPTSKLIRQILGAVAEFDKQTLIARLQAGKRRARAAGGNPGGQVSHAVANPDAVREAKRLRRRNPKNGRVRSYRKIAEELAGLGHLSASGCPFSAQSVKNMVGGPKPED